MSETAETVATHSVHLIQNEHHHNSVVIEPPLDHGQYNAVAQAIFSRQSAPAQRAFTEASEENLTRIRTLASDERLVRRGETVVKVLERLGIVAALNTDIQPGY